MPSQPAQQFLEGLRSIRRDVSHGTYAPHKPLLLLWALGRVQQGEPRLVSYRDAEKPLDELLRDFGPTNRTKSSYPFWYARNDDGVWDLEHQDKIEPGGARPPRVSLMRQFAVGGLPADVDAALRKDDGLLKAAVEELVGYLPESQPEEVLAACGLSVNFTNVRDSAFRDVVLTAYEQRCAICGWDVRVADRVIALEAAHVWQWTEGGPDQIDNGVCLCSLHHKAYDRGALSFSDDRRVLISQRATGGEMLSQLLLRHSGKPLREPQPGNAPPNLHFIRRHREFMFREPARPM